MIIHSWVSHIIARFVKFILSVRNRLFVSPSRRPPRKNSLCGRKSLCKNSLCAGISLRKGCLIKIFILLLVPQSHDPDARFHLHTAESFCLL